MKNIIKDACILFAITLVAGILLGLVYNVTKDPIAQQNEKAKQKAYQELQYQFSSLYIIAGNRRK